MAVKNIGTHVTHCCLRHGCKYREDECPVTTGEYTQEFACEYCTSSATLEARIKETEEELEWSRSLEARGLKIYGYDD
jgi:hypothetical protein